MVEASLYFSLSFIPLMLLVRNHHSCLDKLSVDKHLTAFDFGTTLINRGEASAGDVVNVFLAILIGSFSLALLAPEMQGLSLYLIHSCTF